MASLEKYYQLAYPDRIRQFGNDRLRRGRVRVVLTHHHPADVVDHHIAPLIGASRAHVDDAGLPVLVLPETNHDRRSRKRIASWPIVYQQAQRWMRAGCFEALAEDSHILARLADGRNAQPSAAYRSQTLSVRRFRRRIGACCGLSHAVAGRIRATDARAARGVQRPAAYRENRRALVPLADQHAFFRHRPSFSTC